MAAQRDAWDKIWDELMNDHGWVLDSANIVGDEEFDAENILAEYTPVVENVVPTIGEELEVMTTTVEEEISEGVGASGEEATRGGDLSQEATGGGTAVEGERAECGWWRTKDPNEMVLELGVSDVPGVQEEEEDDVLIVVAVRKNCLTRSRSKVIFYKNFISF